MKKRTGRGHSAAGRSAKKGGAAAKPASGVRTAKRAGRGRETVRARRDRASVILSRLHEEYPEARTALQFEGPYELLVATILSAQCTDERVNQVTPGLFRKYPTAVDLADAKREDVEELIRSTGFFRNKTKSLLGMANAVVERFGGEIPDTMEDLVELPGVGRKTANVVLGNAFGKDEGVVVDTHVARLSQRMGLTGHTDPVRIEQDLMKLFPENEWTALAHVLIFHGRATCKAQRPRCEQCVVSDLCPSSRV